MLSYFEISAIIIIRFLVFERNVIRTFTAMTATKNLTKKPPKIKNKLKSFLMNHIREFCDKTSIHGLRYVTENKSHWFQSLMWASFIVLGITFCCSLMVLIWTRFYTNPTITAVETINFPVWNVPFPAVTICNSNKVHTQRIDNIKQILISSGFEEEYAIDFFKSLSNLVLVNIKSKNYTDVFKLLLEKGYNPEKIMKEVMQPCEELLKRCTWMGDLVDCVDLFKTIKTDEGFCCTFNYFQTNETFDKPEHSIKTLYKEKPIQISGAGIHTGLSVVLNVDAENYMSATRNTPSALVHVHDSYDYAEMTVLGMVAKMGDVIQMPVNPSVVDTTDDVKSLSRKRRNCIFVDEAQLLIGVYGYENCIIECRMNAIVDMCGCIPFYYNVKNYTYKTPLKFCEISDMPCISKNYRNLYTLRSTEVSDVNSTKIGLECSCFPTCDVNWYTYSSDVGHMENDETNNYREIIAIHVYFSELTCIKYKQSNLITWDGLFASFGGIFGLCLGGSILSIVEIIYHFTIRLYMSYASWSIRIIDDKPKINNISVIYDKRDFQRIQVAEYKNPNKRYKQNFA